jgi:hypothetical protein
MVLGRGRKKALKYRLYRRNLMSVKLGKTLRFLLERGLQLLLDSTLILGEGRNARDSSSGGVGRKI